MKIKELLKYEKDNMPDFQWKFEKFLGIFILIWLGGAILALIAGLIISFLTKGQILFAFIPFIIWVCSLLIGCVILIFKSINVKRQLIAYYFENIEFEYRVIDYDEAKQKLIEEQRITQSGIIVDKKNFFDQDYFDEQMQSDGTKIVPFEKIKVIFNPRFFVGKLVFEIVFMEEYEWAIVDNLDSYLYSYLLNNKSLIENKKVFDLFCENKDRFIRELLKYNNALKMEQKLYGKQ